MKISNYNKIHFIGVGGYGVSALARLFIENGAHISGSDIKENIIVKKLIASGMDFHIGHSPEFSGELPELVVYSSAVKEDNPELCFFRSKYIPCIKRGEALGLYSKEKKTIAIAGTHGKTTTTSMISHILSKCGLSPTSLVGGEMLLEQTNALIGSGKWLVTEADESDASFLHLNPSISLITNIEEDHMDFYSSRNELINTFKKFAENTSEFIILNNDNPITNILSTSAHTIKFSMSDSRCDWYASEITHKEYGQRFSLYKNGKRICKVSLMLPGNHNIQNALASIAAATLAGISPEQAADTISDFIGVARRIQLLYNNKNIKVYDDYAHHPTEVEAVLSALRENFPKNRLIAVFQPHRFSRFSYFIDSFSKSLSIADKVFLCDIYSSGENDPGNISSKDLIPLLNTECTYIPDLSTMEEMISSKASPGDIIIALGAGTITYSAQNIAKRMENIYG